MPTAHAKPTFEAMERRAIPCSIVGFATISGPPVVICVMAEPPIAPAPRMPGSPEPGDPPVIDPNVPIGPAGPA